MEVTSYLLGKKSGGGSQVNLQNNKSVTITTNNSTTEVTPDEGYDATKKVTVTTNIPTGSTIDLSSIGYSNKNQQDTLNILNEAIDYAEDIYANWDNTVTDREAQFKNDGNMMIFPNVDMSNVTNAKEMFNRTPLMSISDDFNFFNLNDTTAMFSYTNLKYVNNVDLSSNLTFCACSQMFSYMSDLEVNNFKTSRATSNYIPFYQVQNLTINKLGINANVRTIISQCTNVDIKEVENYDNHTSRSRAILNASTFTSGAIKELLKYLKTLTSQLPAYKTLLSMGFTQENCNQAVLLSEWQDLVDAGWTTGY